MKAILASCLALLLCGCNVATSALTVGAALLGQPPPPPPPPQPPPQVVQVEPAPVFCTTYTHGNLTQTSCH
jgi:hypothetical protein